MRKPHSYSSLFSTSLSPDEDCTGPDYEDCNINTPHLTPSSLASFTSCTVSSLTSKSNGGAVYLHDTSSSPGTALTVIDCTFTSCVAAVSSPGRNGGGAIYIDSGALSVTSSVFIACKSSFFGGGVLAQNDCSSSAVSHSTFISCRAVYGGGLMTYCGPISEIISSRCISCTGSIAGGGLYHDSTDISSAKSTSNCLFFSNSAENSTDTCATRGGGAFEDFHSQAYSSSYFFSFFHRNKAHYSYGHDLSSQGSPVPIDHIQQCFTTTAIHSFWNSQSDGFVNWLPLTHIHFDLSQHTHTHNNPENSHKHLPCKSH